MKKLLRGFLTCGLGVSLGCLAQSAINAPDSPKSSETLSTTDSKAAGTAPVADSTTGEVQWLTSLPDAQALARKESKLVLVDFTGSDWCVWCKKLDAETFSKSEFADYARKHLVLVQLDFPSQKPQAQSLKDANQALMHKYNVDGFPTLVVMKADGSVVWKQTGYLEGGPSAMLAKLEEARKK